MTNILFVNACVKHKAVSRTESLAQAYLGKRLEDKTCQIKTVILEDTAMSPLSAASLNERDKAISNNDFSDASFELAKSFAAADEVVIAAPYWDMSFPALLKLYIEQLCVNKLTFYYDETGRPRGLVNVKKVIYFTTSGGYIGNANFGYEYIKGVFSTLFGISDISFFSAEGLDIYGNDADKILKDATEKMLVMTFHEKNL